LQQHHGKNQPFAFTITWISSLLLTATREWERRNQTTLLRVYSVLPSHNFAITPLCNYLFWILSFFGYTQPI
jgi:hypothetical protein